MNRPKETVLIALIVLLSGCSGLAGSDVDTGIIIETTTGSDTLDYESSDYTSATIANEADTNKSTTFSVSFAGQEVHNSTETLTPGSSDDIQVYYNSSDLEPGTYELVFEIDGDIEVREIEILEPTPANFEINNVDGATGFPVGSPAQFDVSVENTGDLSESSEVTASFVGHEVSETIELDGGEETTISFETSEINVDQDSYILEITTLDDDLRRNVEVTHPSFYGSTDIALYIDSSEVDRDISHVVDESTSYWENNADEYLSFEVQYDIVESRSAADKVLTFEESTTCGTEYSESYLGCADLITSDVDQTVELSVDHRLSDAAMIDTTTHELGHTLGLDHDDEPQDYMSEPYNNFEASQPVKFHIRSDNGNLPQSIESEVETALDYYESRGDFQYELVDSEEEAHHLVTYHSSGTVCGFSTGGSCSVEGDYETQIDFRLDQLDSDVVAWHVAMSLAGPAVDELPEDIDPDDDRRDRERFPQ